MDNANTSTRNNEESFSEDLGRPIPGNKNVVAEDRMAMMSRAKKVCCEGEG